MGAELDVGSVVLGPAAWRWRAVVGPVSWVVLEELVHCARVDAAGLVASVSVRSLASSLRLSKDTVARGLQRLCAVGLVSVSQSRVEAGRFASCSYRLRVPADVLSQLAVPLSATSSSCDPDATGSPVVRRRPRRAVSSFSQLSFVIER